MATQQREVHLVFRHGARGPSCGALKPFEGAEAATQWADAEIETLTTVGREQCVTLGEALGRTLLGGKQVKSWRWHSSKVSRVVESGQAFLCGLRRAGVLAEAEEELAKAVPAPIEHADEDPDRFFRGFSFDAEYKAKADALRSGEVFAAKAAEAVDELELVKPLVAAAAEPHELLNWCTYVEELLVCEHFWRGDEPRRAVTNALAPGGREVVARLARWCWNERFFKLAGSETLARPLLDHICTQLDRKPEAPAGDDGEGTNLVLYSAHDYTMMGLLNGLGVEAFPEVPLGYCCYMVFEGDTVQCNLEPFAAVDAPVALAGPHVRTLRRH